MPLETQVDLSRDFAVCVPVFSDVHTHKPMYFMWKDFGADSEPPGAKREALTSLSVKLAHCSEAILVDLHLPSS